MDVRYIFDTDEIEVTDDLGFPTYYPMSELEQIDANERELGKETEYLIREIGLHVVMYPSGVVSDFFTDKTDDIMEDNKEIKPKEAFDIAMSIFEKLPSNCIVPVKAEEIGSKIAEIIEKATGGKTTVVGDGITDGIRTVENKYPQKYQK